MAVDIPIRYSRDDKALQETIKDWKKLQKEIGVTDKEIESANKSTKDLKKESDNLAGGFGNLKGVVGKLGIAAAFGAALVQVQAMVAETAKLRKEISSFTGTGGQELDKLTAKVKALSDVWGIDYLQAIQSSNAVQKAFIEDGITQAQVLDRIAEGLSRGAEISGEFLDSLREYPDLAKQNGLSFEQFFRVLEKSAEAGIYSDKGIDSIKEAGLQITRMTDSTSKALQRIGIDAQQVERELASGDRSVISVIQEISEKLSDIPPQSKLFGDVVSEVFRTAGEDAGRFVLMLNDIDEAQQKVSKTSEQYRQIQIDEYEAYQKLNEELSKLGGSFSDVAAQGETFVVETGAKLLGWVNSFIDALSNAKVKAESFSESITQGIGSEEATRQLREINEEIRKLESELSKADARIAAAPDNSIFGNTTTKRVEEFNKQQNQEALAQFRKQREELLEIMRGWEETYDAKNKVDGDAGQNDTGDLTNKIKEQRYEIEKLTASAENGLLNAYQKVFGFRPDDPQSGADLDSYIQMGGKEQLSGVTDAFEEAEKLRTQKLKEQAEERKKIAEDEANTRREIYEAGIYAVFEITNALSEIRRSKTDEELAYLQEVENSKLSLVGDNAQAQEQIIADIERRRKEALKREAEAEKEFSAFQAFINTAEAITRVLGNPFAVAFVAAAGLAQQIAIRSRSVPGYKHGTKNVPGIDTGGDTVAAMLRPGEKVFSRETSKAYEPALDAIFDRKITPEVANAAFSGASNSKSGVMYTPKDLETAVGRALQKIPFHNISIDKQGFHDYVKSVGMEVSKDLNEFKF